MPPESFARECDRLSHVVDDIQYERLRWARTEGPMLATLADLAKAALADRSDFELVEEGATRDVKRFVMKIHGNRVVALTLSLDSGRAIVAAELAERSKYALIPGTPASADFTDVDAAWMAAALKGVFSRIVPA